MNSENARRHDPAPTGAPDMVELKRAAAERVERCYCEAEQKLGQRFRRPQVQFNQRGMAAATAHVDRNLIRLNPTLLQSYADDFLSNTIPHEVSHLLAYQIFGRRIAPHGREWASIMVGVFGRTPRRCHDYDVRPTMKAVFRYRCGCHDGHWLTVRRHNSARRGRRYVCRRCRLPIRFSPNEGLPADVP